MRRNLYDLLTWVLFPTFVYGYISRNGSVSAGTRSSAPVGFRKKNREQLGDMPGGLRTYFEGCGLLPLIHSTVNWLNHIEFWRKEDDARLRCSVHLTTFYMGKRSAKAFADAGIKSFTGDRAWVVYTDRDSYEALYRFLTEAGVRLTEYTPPWLVLGSMRIKPSSRRPGPEDARFFGF